MPIFWLVVLIGNNTNPLHVGNFSSLDSCQKAALEIARGTIIGSAPQATVGAGSTVVAGPGPNVSYVCVQANSGKRRDPGPPRPER
jgi:hypothetical protein